MNPILYLRGEFRRSWGGFAALAVVLALAGSMSPAISMMERGLRSGMAHSADAFDILVGAKGSSADLVLGAVYLRSEPMPLLPEKTLEGIREQKGVRWAAPLAFGDRWKSFPMVGSSADMVNLGGARALSSGRIFLERNEAVAGAGVPLKEGEIFFPSHGRVEEHVLDEHDSHRRHEQGFTVVGKLPATGTPWDRAIIVPIEALWAMHKNTQVTGRCSAIVIKPEGVSDAYRLRALMNSEQIQAVFSGEVLTEIFSMMDDVQKGMRILADFSSVVAFIAAMAAGVFAVSMRVREMVLLRALGASQSFLALAVWLMASSVMLAGCFAGSGLGALAAFAAGSWIEAETGVSIPVAFTGEEWLTAIGMAAAGSLAAFVPAWFACRRAAGVILRVS